jgi:hypothetical protein
MPRAAISNPPMIRGPDPGPELPVIGLATPKAEAGLAGTDTAGTEVSEIAG